MFTLKIWLIRRDNVPVWLCPTNYPTKINYNDEKLCALTIVWDDFFFWTIFWDDFFLFKNSTLVAKRIENDIAMQTCLKIKKSQLTFHVHLKLKKWAMLML